MTLLPKLMSSCEYTQLACMHRQPPKKRNNDRDSRYIVTDKSLVVFPNVVIDRDTRLPVNPDPGDVRCVYKDIMGVLSGFKPCSMIAPEWLTLKFAKRKKYLKGARCAGVIIDDPVDFAEGLLETCESHSLMAFTTNAGFTTLVFKREALHEAAALYVMYFGEELPDDVVGSVRKIIPDDMGLLIVGWLLGYETRDIGAFYLSGVLHGLDMGADPEMYWLKLKKSSQRFRAIQEVSDMYMENFVRWANEAGRPAYLRLLRSSGIRKVAKKIQERMSVIRAEKKKRM